MITSKLVIVTFVAKRFDDVRLPFRILSVFRLPIVEATSIPVPTERFVELIELDVI